MTRLISIFRLVRGLNCLMTSASVWVGTYLTSGAIITTHVAAAMLGALFVCAAGNIVNDLVDIESDCVSHPGRMLVSGRVQIATARWLAVIVHILALVFAALANLLVLIVAAICLALLLAYNLRLKRVPGVGNLTVAILGGLPFVCGGLAVHPNVIWVLPGPWVAAIFAFFFHFIREVIKDVEDIAGDQKARIRTLPHVIGTQGALGIALGLFAVLATLTLVPVWMSWYGRAYTAIVILLIDLPLLALLVTTFLRPTETAVKWSRAGLKIGMAFGLLALLVA